MALYIPLSRRRRNAALVAIATLLAGLVVGFLVGRTSVVTVSERADDVRMRGDTLGTRLEALTIEYEQAVGGTGDTIQGGVIDALDLIDHDLDGLFADAPWLGPVQTTAVRAAVQSVRDAATASVDPADFTTIVDTSAKLVRDTFGVQH